MKISFSLIGATGKRWHGKVVRRACLDLCGKMVESANSFPGILSAEFDENESSRVRVVEKMSKDGVVTSICFATKNWESLSESIPQCESQLISALVELEERGRIESKSIPPEFDKRHTVVFSRLFSHDDGLKDIYWYINKEMDSDSFSSLVDELDNYLTHANFGEVSGSSFSLSKYGSCIDIVSRDADKAVSAIKKFAEERGVSDFEFGGGFA